MRKFIVSTLIVFAGVSAYSQQDAQFTQNMFNKLGVNPGSAGHNGGICGTILTRSQWMGFDGRPQTHLFSADALIFNKHGIGLTLFQDKLGIESNFVGKLAYSYHLMLGPGTLGIGAEVGVINKSYGDNFVAIDNYLNDPSIPNASTSAMTFDAGFGLYYHIKDKMYVGISTLHIPQTELKDVAANGPPGSAGALSYAQSRHYYVMAGYDWDIRKDQMWILKPSILAKTDAASTQLDANAIILYNKLVWGGVSYRVQDAVAALAGVDFTKVSPSLKGLKLGVSYDVTTSALGDHSSGSLEFMLKYCTNIVSPPTREVYHSVRFL
ncbi:MAG: type IX secretion system membrane protein PorP/SprF [Flavobacteriales bacterium]|nr:type IX secretion system membrane protein PorP/SprF [Flavobacteriales bacterium]